MSEVLNECTEARYPLEAFAADIAGIEMTLDARAIRMKSRDRYAVSPLLRTMLEGKEADVVVSPTTLDELKRVVSAAVRRRIPITVRGAGSANYGQSVPLKGGILLDMTAYKGIVSIKPGAVRAKAGTLVTDIEKATRESGWEMRFHPTTARVATIAGFVAGGMGGPGSVVYGILRDRGNIRAIQVMTMEEQPRLLELTGPDAQFAHHTYGTTGIITEVEMPLVTAWPWIEAIVAFPDYIDTVRFGVTLANQTGITRKVVSVQEWPTPRLIRQFAGIVPEGHSICSTMIADHSWQDFTALVESQGGKIVSMSAEGQGPYGAPLWEFVFGHALAQIQKSEPKRSMVEGFFRAPDLVDLVSRVHAKVSHYGPMRMELIRIGGDVVGSGAPYFTYESAEQMATLVREMQEAGAMVSNSHTSNVRSVGKKEITERDVAFKRAVDPHGLLNPGRFEVEDSSDAKFAIELPTDQWDSRLA
ncbi:MAG: FAD-binding oxidoreductase [Moraxellaceae bacterium]|nr:FAD-binding oxidoreductase [Moraxellaceae bacterium]